MRDQGILVQPYRRRAVLRAAVTGAALSAGSALLAACGGTTSPTVTAAPTTKPTTAPASSSAPAAVTPTTAPAASAASPTTTPSVAATMSPASAVSGTASGTTAASPMADASGKIASGNPAVPDAYLKYPPTFKTVAVIPGKGGKVTIFKASQLPPPTPKDQNAYWQELDKRLGVQTDYTMVPISSFREKFVALTASGDLSDINLIYPSIAPDQYKAIQQGAFTDLTPYLMGDTRNEYPNLAKYPDFAWKNSLIKGKLWWVPRMNFLWGGNELMYRKDWLSKLGLAEPKNTDEFFNTMVAFTKNDPDGNGKPDTWGLGGYSNSFGVAWSIDFLRGMFRVPHNWRKNPDGTLTYFIETDEFKQTLAFAKKLFDAGVYHPDTATWTQNQAQDAMIAGKIGAKGDSLIQLLGGVQERQKARKQNPAADLRSLVPPGWDGGKGVTYNGPGVPYANGIPAKVGKDQGRVKELLRVLDYFGALFGSEEYTFLTFGIKDRDHTINASGSPVLTEQGKAEVNELGNVVFPPRTYYFPEDPPEDTVYLQKVTQDALAEGIDDPTLNAYSPTFATKAGELNQLNLDRLTAIVTGRDPLAALDTWVKDWRSRGGDMVRKEYEQELKG